MTLFAPGPEGKFTLADLGIFASARCAVFDRITTWGERLNPGAGCLLFLRDVENRRVIVRSKGAVAARHVSHGRHLLAGSLTDEVCSEGADITEADLLAWSPTMPEIADYGATSFAAVAIDGPAQDRIGMLALMSTEAPLEHDRALEDARGLALLAGERIMLKATMATLKRIAQERVFDVPPLHMH